MVNIGRGHIYRRHAFEFGRNFRWQSFLGIYRCGSYCRTDVRMCYGITSYRRIVGSFRNLSGCCIYLFKCGTCDQYGYDGSGQINAGDARTHYLSFCNYRRECGVRCAYRCGIWHPFDRNECRYAWTAWDIWTDFCRYIIEPYRMAYDEKMVFKKRQKL